jgi:tetratricopeptide (TPR) repeat protein
MRRSSLFIAACILLLVCSLPAIAGEVDEKIKEAETLANSGDVMGAVALLEKVTAEFPENSDAMAYLGLYTGMGAGQAQSYDEAGRLMMLSFERLDTAVKLDKENPEAYLFRGIIGINVPGFFGRLEAGISDLEQAVEMYGASSSPDAGKGMVAGLTNLAEGYAKNEDPAGQKRALEKIIAVAPGTEAAKAAEEQLKGLGDVEEKPEIDTGLFEPKDGDSEQVLALKKSLMNDHSDPAVILQLGEAYYSEESFYNAMEILKVYTSIDKTNGAAYKMLALSTAYAAEKGYDESIYTNTDTRSNLAFELMAAWDKAVELSPDDMELRLTRGTFGLIMPFFLGKHDQSVADLEMVVDSDASEEMKAEALYYLGFALEREALNNYIKLARDYPKSEGARLAFDRMKPSVVRVDENELDTPCVKIDFILGFQDQLAPQTAVWIDDEDENHIRTLYVSGFAGYVKEKQITLPLWAAVTKFEGIDGVTSASIDIGHHIFIWDLKDFNGEKVKKGKYRVRVETSHWPSNLYQNVEAFIEVGKKENSVRLEEGDFIPFFEVTYIK